MKQNYRTVSFKNKPLGKFSGFIFFGLLYFFILTPYLEVGGFIIHTGMLALALTFSVFYKSLWPTIRGADFFCFMLLMLMLTTWVSLNSVIRAGVLDFSYQRYYINLALYFFAGGVVGNFYRARRVPFQQIFYWLLKAIVLVAAINATIIILEFFFPPFKALIESFLYLSDNSNINYTERLYRLRGFAAGGAANQSVFLGAAAVILLALFMGRRVSFVAFSFQFLFILISLLFVGRTGIFVVIIGFGMLLFVQPTLKAKINKRAMYFMVLFLVLILSAPVLLPYFVPEYIISNSVIFLYSGIDGIKEEGTLYVLLEMFNISEHWHQFVFGAGNGSGNFSDGVSSDLGYMKAFTALGVPLGVLLYLFFIILLNSAFRIAPERFLMATLTLIFFVVEIKEPLIFKGYFARTIWFMVGLSIAYRGQRFWSMDHATQIRS
jgi:hypothetical protein